jgi:hypothetical protein
MAGSVFKIADLVLRASITTGSFFGALEGLKLADDALQASSGTPEYKKSTREIVEATYALGGAATGASAAFTAAVLAATVSPVITGSVAAAVFSTAAIEAFRK